MLEHDLQEQKLKAEKNLREFFKKWLGVDAWVSERAVGLVLGLLLCGFPVMGSLSHQLIDRGRGLGFSARVTDTGGTVRQQSARPASGRNYQRNSC